MDFRNLNAKSLLINLLIALAYPIIKFFSSSNRLLAFSDACVIIGLFLVIVGMANWLFLKGDFDITAYIAERSLKKENRDFDVYMEDQKEKRKDSFNYPLLCAVILLLISYLTSLFV